MIPAFLAVKFTLQVFGGSISPFSFKKIRGWTSPIKVYKGKLHPSKICKGELHPSKVARRKQLTLFEGDRSIEVHTEIMQASPQLHEGGWYELMRISESGQRVLQVIPSRSDGYSVTCLKQVLHQAKVYIRPVQKSLSLVPCDVTANVSIMYISDLLRVIYVFGAGYNYIHVPLCILSL